MKKSTYTKQMVKVILAVALIDMQFPFVLAFLNRTNIAEELGKIIVTEIIGVVLVYCLKAFFETREEKKNELLMKKEDIENE